jgi:hypothetical protein
MFSKMWLINLALLCGVVFMGLQANRAWKGDPVLTEMAAESPSSQATSQSVRPLLSERMQPESAFDSMVEKNLFSPTRKEILPEVVEEEPEKKLQKAPTKELALHGVVMLGDYKAALIRNLRPPTKNEKGKSKSKISTKPAGVEEKWRKIGETVGSFKVAEIHSDRVVLEGKAKKIELLLYDKDKPIKPVFKPKKGQPVTASIESSKKVVKPSSTGEGLTQVKPTKTRSSVSRDSDRYIKAQQRSRTVSKRKKNKKDEDRESDREERKRPGFGRPE